MGDVARVLNHGQAASWTVERLRRTVRRLASEGIIEANLLDRARPQPSDGRLVRLIAGINAAAPDRTLQVTFDLDDPRITRHQQHERKTAEAQARTCRPCPAPPHDWTARSPTVRPRQPAHSPWRRYPPSRRGLTVLVRKGKSNQDEGRLIGIHANRRSRIFCLAVAFRASGADWAPSMDQSAECWRAPRKLFCCIGKAGTFKERKITDLVVARLLKTTALYSGLDPVRFSGNSLADVLR